MEMNYMWRIFSASIVLGAGGFIYGLKATFERINSIVDTKAVRNKKHSQHIYISPHYQNDPEEPLNEGDDANESHLLIKWWQYKKIMVAWRLLEMAQSLDKHERIKATRTLVSLKHLQDHDYRHLAQCLDSNTSVALARCKGVDMRFFLKPTWSKCSKNKEELLNRLRDLLYSLNQAQKHICIKYFLNKAFPSLRNWMSFLDLEMTALEGPAPITISESTIIPMCIQSLGHHSSIKGNAQTMVQHGVLSVLMDSYRFLGCTKETSFLLVKLIKIIATYPEHLNDLYVTGWIGVIAEWLKTDDNRLSVPAATILTNIDRDSDCKCGNNIFLLHPNYRPTELAKAEVDVVVVHGLLGGIHYTWRQRQSCPEADTIFGRNDEIFIKCAMSNSTISDMPASLLELKEEDVGEDYVYVFSDIPVSESRSSNLNNLKEFKLPLSGNEDYYKQTVKVTNNLTLCWPKDWLSQDCERIRILGLNYESKLSDWLSWCPVKDKGRKKILVHKSKELLDQLIDCGVGDKPIVWVTHSMGGILVKHILVLASKKQKENEAFNKIVKNSNSIVFLSTPHYGTPLATLNEASKFLFLPSREVEELSYNSPTLVKLHSDFLEFLNNNPLNVFSFIETKCMKITPWKLEVRCVPPQAEDICSGLVFEIPLGHMDICKPNCRFSFIYQTILQIVRSAAKANNF